MYTNSKDLIFNHQYVAIDSQVINYFEIRLDFFANKISSL